MCFLASSFTGAMVRAGKTLLQIKVSFLPYDPSYLQNSCLRVGASTLPLRIPYLFLIAFIIAQKIKVRKCDTSLASKLCLSARCTNTASIAVRGVRYVGCKKIKVCFHNPRLYYKSRINCYKYIIFTYIRPPIHEAIIYIPAKSER